MWDRLSELSSQMSWRRAGWLMALGLTLFSVLFCFAIICHFGLFSNTTMRFIMVTGRPSRLKKHEYNLVSDDVVPLLHHLAGASVVGSLKVPWPRVTRERILSRDLFKVIYRDETDEMCWRKTKKKKKKNATPRDEKCVWSLRRDIARLIGREIAIERDSFIWMIAALMDNGGSTRWDRHSTLN